MWHPYYAEIFKEPLRPARPGLAAARAAVRWIWGAGAAWRALVARGVISEAFASDPRRSFESGKDASQRHPATVGACVAIAADPEGVVAVEALALEFAARLAAAGVRSASRLRWRVGCLTAHDLFARPRREPTGDLHSVLFGAHENDEATIWDRGGPSWVTHPDLPLRYAPGLEDFSDGTTFGRVQREISASQLWQSAALYGYRLDNGANPADLRDPFEPLFAIWRRGYAVDTLIDDTLVLLAPPA